MGVKNLWDILECCKKTVPLHHLQNKRVCVDLSCWMVQLHNVNKTHGAMKSKLYLQCLFHRLRALIALNCSLILVTDGSIPSIKLSAYRRRLNDGIEVNQQERKSDKVSLRRNKGSKFSCMVKEAKILCKALGIPCLDGVEEAEAQCALLNSESLCDGCFTSDSDAFLFGARTIYRDICLGEGGYVICYEMADIERKLGFGRNSLISLAVILGGDYSKGVHGLGRESAIEILKSVDDDSVLQQISSEGLSFLKKGKGSKKKGNVSSLNHEGDDNSESNKASIYHIPALAVFGNEINIQGDKEFLQVINAYLKPKCHPADSDVVRRALAVYPFSQTELHQICSQFFEWSPEKTDEYILPKIAERELRRYAFTSSEAGVKLKMYKMQVRCPISSIFKPRKLQGRDCFEVSWEDMHGLKTSVVPADLVERACPEKIQEFQEGKAQAKKRNPCKQRQKKSENAPSVVELDSKRQKLLLDIDEDYKTIEAANRLSEADLSLQELLLKNELYSEAELSYEFDCNLEPSNSSETAEVIDLCTPLPIKNRCVSKHRVECFDVIDLSDSENDSSPDCALNDGELRPFVVIIEDD